MDKLLFIIQLLVTKKFTGTLHISFYNGGIAQVRKDVSEVYDLRSVPTITVEQFVANI
jgi:hypothetical protein